MKLESVFTANLTISLIIGITYIPSSLSRNESIVILVLPQIFVDEWMLRMERREEILQGALMATEDINNNQLVHNLELVMADGSVLSKYDNLYSGNLLEVIANLTWQRRLGDIIGIAGFLDPGLLLSLRHFDIPIVSVVNDGELPNVNYLTASTAVLSESIIQLMKVINKSRFGVITGLHHSYFLSVSKELYSRARESKNISVSLYVQVGLRVSIPSIVDEIAATNVQSIVLSVNPSIATKLLCEAYSRQLKWPNYTWITYGYLHDELVMDDMTCSHRNISEGIINFKVLPNEHEFDVVANSKSCWKNRNDLVSNTSLIQKLNPLAYLLYHTVWSLTLASLNKSSVDQEYSKCSNNIVYIYQKEGAVLNPIGIYDDTLHIFTNICKKVSCGHRELPVILKKFPLPTLMVLPSLCILTNTVLLFLYIYFHNKPSIKSTSVSLSLLIFLGCYLLVAYTITLTIAKSQSIRPLHLDLCMVLVWLSGLGLSLPLILATVLVKMLRVYRIFTLQKVLKPRVYTSTYAHFVYVLLIVSPTVIILLLWTIIDPYRLHLEFVEHSNFTTVYEKCISDKTSTMTAALLIYAVLLSFVVIAVAIKSRKIRFAQFKDTKKVNLFIFLILIVGVSCYSYWILFMIANLYEDAPAYILYVGHIIFAFLCQSILFFPKVWPPVREKLLRKCLPSARQEGSEYTTSTSLKTTVY